MSESTNTILGEIKLTGDLAGDGGAQLGSNPQLTHISGLTAGQYNVANITVDAKGRIVDIEAADSTDITALIPDASTTVKGKVSIGDNLFINGTASAAYQVVDFGGTLLTTTLTNFSSCATYQLTIQLNGNQVDYSFSGTSLGTDIEDLIAAINAGTTGFTVTLDSGNIKFTTDLTGSPASIDITTYPIFSCLTGFVDVNAAVDGMSACELYAKDASVLDAGVVQIGTGINVASGVISVDMTSPPIATTTTIGGVIVPVSGNVDVDVSGNLSVPVATTSSLGVVQIGSGLTIDGSGVVSYSTASLPIASSSVLGCVKDGTGVSINGSGVLTLDVSGIAKATEISVGVVQIGNGLDVDVNGIVSVDLTELTLPKATTSTLGAVVIGNGLDVDVSGVINVDGAEFPAIGTSIFGAIKAGNANDFDITGGVLNIGSNIPKKNTANTFSKSQVVSQTTQTYTSFWTPDLSLSNQFFMTLTGGLTLVNPSLASYVGGQFRIILRQDGSGSRTISYGSNYKFASGAVTTLTTTPNAYDILFMEVLDANNILCRLEKGWL